MVLQKSSLVHCPKSPLNQPLFPVANNTCTSILFFVYILHTLNIPISYHLVSLVSPFSGGNMQVKHQFGVIISFPRTVTYKDRSMVKIKMCPGCIEYCF